MDKLKNFIEHHRQNFEQKPDFENFWKDFEKRQTPKKFLRLSKKQWRGMAATLLLLLGSFWILKPKESPNPELAEAQNYYTAMIDQKMQVIRTHQSDIDEHLLHDLAAMDSAFRELKADLKENAANQAVVSAMIQHYRLKLRILEEIETQIVKQDEQSPTKQM